MKMKQNLLFILMVCLLTSLLLMSPLFTAAAENLAANGDLELGSTNGWDIANASISSSVKYAPLCSPWA